MHCDEAERFLDAYLDGESELSQQLALEQHLSGCKECQSALEQRRGFRAFLAAAAPQYKAPAGLREKILAITRQKPTRSRVEWSTLWRRPWVYAAALFIIGLPILLAFYGKREHPYTAQAVSNCLRALFIDHLSDIDSSDLQVVKSYLTAKLNFSPPVMDLASAGYEMHGGRVDIVQNCRVAVLLYRRNKDLITLFTWPSTSHRCANSNQVMSGLTICTWNDANLNFIAVSTLNDDQLDEFTELFREKIH